MVQCSDICNKRTSIVNIRNHQKLYFCTESNKWYRTMKIHVRRLDSSHWGYEMSLNSNTQFKLQAAFQRHQHEKMMACVEIGLSNFNLLQILHSTIEVPETTRARYLPFANINARKSPLTDQMNQKWHSVSGQRLIVLESHRKLLTHWHIDRYSIQVNSLWSILLLTSNYESWKCVNCSLSHRDSNSFSNQNSMKFRQMWQMNVQDKICYFLCWNNVQIVLNRLHPKEWRKGLSDIFRYGMRTGQQNVMWWSRQFWTKLVKIPTKKLCRSVLHLSFMKEFHEFVKLTWILRTILWRHQIEFNWTLQLFNFVSFLFECLQNIGTHFGGALYSKCIEQNVWRV